MVSGVAAGVLLAAAVPQAAVAAPPDKQPLLAFDTGEPVTGAFSMLRRSDDAVTSKIRTAAAPGHAVTYWYLVVAFRTFAWRHAA